MDANPIGSSWADWHYCWFVGLVDFTSINYSSSLIVLHWDINRNFVSLSKHSVSSLISVRGRWGIFVKNTDSSDYFIFIDDYIWYGKHNQIFLLRYVLPNERHIACFCALVNTHIWYIQYMLMKRIILRYQLARVGMLHRFSMWIS